MQHGLPGPSLSGTDDKRTDHPKAQAIQDYAVSEELVSRLVTGYSSPEELNRQIRRWKAVLQNTWNL